MIAGFLTLNLFKPQKFRIQFLKLIFFQLNKEKKLYQKFI